MVSCPIGFVCGGKRATRSISNLKVPFPAKSIQWYDFSDMLNEINLARVDLNLLVVFEAVLKERHVGQAAEKLNLSASAISHSLGRLRRLLNDPLFLRTPRGVVPTARATELAEPIADILARVRGVLATAEPFDPATSTRRFMIAAPDAVLAVLLPYLLAGLARLAPGINLGLRQALPPPNDLRTELAWQPVLEELETAGLDLALLPVDNAPARFAVQKLYDDFDFVIAMRAGHPLLDDPTLDRFCAMQHVIVSLKGDPFGFVDSALALENRSRRVALTVPSFMTALGVIASSDLLGAIPRLLVSMYGPRLGLTSIEMPVQLPLQLQVSAVATKAALSDAGVAWLWKVLPAMLD